jgi:hypothetical protein
VKKAQIKIYIDEELSQEEYEALDESIKAVCATHNIEVVELIVDVDK